MGFYDNNVNIATTAAGLAIKEAKSAAAKVSNTTHFHINGELFYVTTKDVVIPATVTIENDMQCMLTVMTDIAGTISVVKGTEFTKSSHYTTDLISKTGNATKAILGYIYIKNETDAQFVGGTTALDAANLTVSYVDAFTSLGM